MRIEEEITSYLHEHGDTREADIVKWGIQRFNYTKRGMKKAIARMLESGKIDRIFHSQLKPPGVYLTVMEHKRSQKEKTQHKASLIQRLIVIRERYRELPKLIFVLGLMLFYLIAFTPPIYDAVGSVNMTAWNFTGHEALRVVFPVIPYIFVLIMLIVLFGLGLDIAKIFHEGKYALLKSTKNKFES